MKFDFKNLFQPLFVFYVLVVYILATFFWWSTLHVQKNKQIFQDQIALMQLQYEKQGKDPQTVFESAQYLAIEDKLNKQNMMICGEGLVFLLLLGMGIFKIHSGFRKELMLNRQQRNFLLSITHELKSPLAGIKLALQTITKRKLSEENQTRLLNNSLKDSERLQNLVNNLLMAAKLDGEDIVFAKEQHNVGNLLHSILDKFTPHSSFKRNFQIDIAPNLFVKGDRTALTSVFLNLIENAIKYSQEGDTVGVSVFQKNQKLYVEISDTGIGVPDNEKKKIFKKFYRVGNEDTRKTKGTGLGLFIVKQLVEKHGGRIVLKDNQPKGSIFCMEFPLLKVANKPAVSPSENKGIDWELRNAS